MVLLASQFNATFPSFFLFEHGSMIQGPHALELINFKAICGHGLYIYRSVTFFRKSHYVSNIFYFCHTQNFVTKISYSTEYKFNSQFSSSANYANIGFSLQKYCSWTKIWVYLSLLDSINEERVAADESPANGPFFHPRQMVANGGWPLNRGFS